MTQPLDGKTVALAEGRQLEDLAALLVAEGAVVLRYPLLSILDAPDSGPVVAWLRDLIDGKMPLVILMTGEAVRRLAGFAERAGLRDAYVAALGRVRTLTRGPKPVQALRELGLTPTRVAAAPTTEGVIESLREETLAGQGVGVTLYAQDNPTLEGFLRDRGAQVRTVLSYVYAPATDDERVIELIGRLERGEIEVLVFTSSPQVDRLREVAKRCSLESALAAGLGRTKVAAVGPVVAETLRQHQMPVSICPEQGWVMKNLVRQIARAFTPGERGA